MLANLQALRALAALGVVVFHYGLMPATALPFRTGAAGVDLFFVLSGFIIAHSSARTTRHFLSHRLIRVIPPYWIATLLAAAATLEAMSARDVGGWLVQSLFYLPGPGGRPALIFVAWTLVYELAFYLIYWLALRLGTQAAPPAAGVALIVLASVPLPSAGPWPLLLEFALGIGVYLAAERGSATDRLGGRGALALAAAGLGLLFLLPRLTAYDPDDYQAIGRVLAWGLPAAAIVLGLVAAERNGLAVRARPVLALGAASYAFYLLHPIAIGQLLRLPALPAPLGWVACLIVAVATAGLAVLFHRAVEAPLLRSLRALLRDRPPVEQRG